LRLALPLLRAMQTFLEVAQRGEVLVEALLVGGGEGAAEALGLVAGEVEHAATLSQGFDVGVDFLGLALHEEALEELFGAAFGGDGGAAAGEAEGLAALAGHGEHDGG